MASSYKLPWFKFYASDWISDGHVRTMTSRQKGWYIDLLCYAWQEGGLPDSLPALRTLTSFYADGEYLDMIPESSSRPLIKELADEFDEIISLFRTKLPDGRITHPRLHKLRLEMEQVSEQKTKAARARWDAPADAHASSREDAHAEHTQSIRNAKQKLESEAKNQKQAAAAGARESTPPASLPNGAAKTADEVCAQVLREMAEEGLLPPRVVENEYGAMLPNPITERIERKLRRRLDAIREAHHPAALVRKIILDELGEGA